MIVTIDEAYRLTLSEPFDFNGLEARVEGGRIPATMRAGDNHVWLAIDRLEALGPADDPEWKSRFAAMIDYARSKGWVNDSGNAVRAHVVAG